MAVDRAGQHSGDDDDGRAVTGISTRLRRRRAARALVALGVVMVPAQVAVGSVVGAGAALALLAAGLWTRPDGPPPR